MKRSPLFWNDKIIKSNGDVVYLGENIYNIGNNAGSHNAIYRGKYLGSSVTAEQYNAISSGTFKDLYIGDHWIINDVTWRIAHFDYWYNCGDRAFTNHHAVVIPDKHLYNAQMNTSDITTGGYIGSAMYTSNLDNAKDIVNNAFGSHALSHREYFINSVSNGKPSGGDWFDSVVDLPNEYQMYGCLFFGYAFDLNTTPIIYTIDKTQFALFMMAPKFITNRDSNWLRDIVSATHFAIVDGIGCPNYRDASRSFGVRPMVAIG